MPFLVTAADSTGSRLSRNGIILTEFLLVYTLLIRACMTTRRGLLPTDTGSKLERAKPCREQPRSNDTALFHLALGQAAQAESMWQEALEHYAMGLSCAPKEPRVLYLLYTNGAHCRNMLGLYTDAEKYCRLAIETDSKRHEAYINLGISLEGQRDMTGAAWCFVEALKANPFNLQAAERLRQLLIDYPTLPMQSPWIQMELDLLERG